MKKMILAIVLSIVGLAVLVYVGFIIYALSILFPVEKFDNNIKNYLKSGDYVKEYADIVLPELDDLPEYEDIGYQFFSNPYYTLGVSETMLLVVTYDQPTYESEKEKLYNDFVFLDYIALERMPANEFSINNYDFGVVNTELSDEYEYPKSFGMIATSDKDSSIVYLFFWDLELDTIGKNGDESMIEFVKENFRYEW